MEAAFIAAVVGCALVGVLVGRWWVLILPLVVVPVFYLGTDQGWWGHGLGDAWQVAMMFVLLLALVVTAAAISLRRIVRRR
jgi:uncharacterized membrane protein YhaH (DUF805 family)